MGRHAADGADGWRAFPPPTGPAVVLGPPAGSLVTVPPGRHALVTIPPDPGTHVIAAAPPVAPSSPTAPAQAGGRRARRLAATGPVPGRHTRSA